MAGSFFSGSWYRIAHLKPKLRAQARFFRSHFRGELWYVLQDRTSGRFHRFTPAAYFVISQLDGSRTMEDIWQNTCAQLQDDSLSQDEIIRLMGQLHSADILQSDSLPDIEEMVTRGESQRFKKRVTSVLNPLALRVPLLDPDGFLRVTEPLVRPLFTIVGAIAYVALIIYGITLAVLNWDGLTDNLLDRVLSTESLALLLITYPVVKAIHELGHAYTIKRWGGEVHEVGVMFLIFVPVPYVDASDSLSFPNKWLRALVASAGILVEVGLAAIAMIVWANVEGGLVRAFAFNVMLISGVSTLLFNGNPLLRFDGYFVLSDLIEIPNLGRRSNQYIGYLLQTRLLGVKEAKNPATAPGEPAWFVFYGIAAFVYRLFITFAIILLVSSKFFSLGIILAIWSVVLMFVVPMAKHVWFLLASPRLRNQRGRALGIATGMLAGIALLIFAVPLPYSTISEGVVWIPGDGAVHAETDGIVKAVAVHQGASVDPDQPLVYLEDPLLDARVRLLEATVAEIQLRRINMLVIDPSGTKIAESELEHAQADLEIAQDTQRDLIVKAKQPGRVALLNMSDLEGQFVTKGQLLGYVSTFREPIIRVVVPESDTDLVRRETNAIDIRFVAKPDETLRARILREVPALDSALPSLALATEGGGRIVLDPSDPSRSRAFGQFLHLDLELTHDHAFETIGDRAMVRFSHEPMSLGKRVYRRARQVFLRQFDI
ncbi:MAG: biotin/lipoyl-binding protein [Pseudomonadota bacterium]